MAASSGAARFGGNRTEPNWTIAASGFGPARKVALPAGGAHQIRQVPGVGPRAGHSTCRAAERPTAPVRERRGHGVVRTRIDPDRFLQTLRIRGAIGAEDESAPGTGQLVGVVVE